MKNHTIFALLFFALGTLAVQAQESKRERIKTLKTAYITQELRFTSAEAEKFWPIYNEYDDKLFQLRKKERQEVWKSIKNGAVTELTEEEAAVLLAQLQQYRQQEKQLREEQEKSLKNVIGAKNTLLLKKAENDFNRQLLNTFKEKK